MRKVKYLLFLLLSASISHAQLTGGDKKSENVFLKENFHSTEFYGLGFGINDNTGLIGFTGEFLLMPMASTRLAIGLGGWGYKMGVEFSFYPKQGPFGSSFNIGFTHATGISEMEMEMEVEPSQVNSERIRMKYLPAQTINLTYAYSWKMGKRGKFMIDFGWAFPVKDKRWTVLTAGKELTSLSESVMRFLQPGGLVLGLKFYFGNRKMAYN